MKRFAFLLATVLTLASGAVAVAASLPDGWHPSVDYPGEWRFWQNGRTVAGVDPTGVLYESRNGRMTPVAHWDVDLTTPTNRNFGVDQSKIGRTERYRINDGTKQWDVTPRQAIEALGPQSSAAKPGAPELPDDSAKLRLTVIGSDAERGPALADVASGPLKDRLLVQDYDPSKPHEQWALRGGFVTTGHPTVYLQQPSGKVLLRTETYDAEKLAAAVRKADPTYDPKKDPDGKPSPIPGIPDLPPTVWAGAILGGLAAVKKAIS